MQYIPAKGEFKDKFEQNQIMLIRGLSDIKNDVRIIEGNTRSQLKLVIHATMGLDLSDKPINQQGNINWRTKRIIEEVQREHNLGARNYIFHIGTAQNNNKSDIINNPARNIKTN